MYWVSEKITPVHFTVVFTRSVKESNPLGFFPISQKQLGISAKKFSFIQRLHIEIISNTKVIDLPTSPT